MLLYVISIYPSVIIYLAWITVLTSMMWFHFLYINPTPTMGYRVYFPTLFHSYHLAFLTVGHNEYFVHLEQIINLPNIYHQLLKEIVRWERWLIIIIMSTVEILVMILIMMLMMIVVVVVVVVWSKVVVSYQLWLCPNTSIHLLNYCRRHSYRSVFEHEVKR